LLSEFLGFVFPAKVAILGLSGALNLMASDASHERALLDSLGGRRVTRVNVLGRSFKLESVNMPPQAMNLVDEDREQAIPFRCQTLSSPRLRFIEKRIGDLTP